LVPALVQPLLAVAASPQLGFSESAASKPAQACEFRRSSDLPVSLLLEALLVVWPAVLAE
jgi:hypothetical protein